VVPDKYKLFFEVPFNLKSGGGLRDISKVGTDVIPRYNVAYLELSDTAAESSRR
jgi:hypothetical protein